MWMSFVLLKDVVCHILQNCCEVSLWGCVCHVCPVLQTSILPQQGLHLGYRSGIAGTARCHAWLLGHVAAHHSPLTRIKHPLEQWNTLMEPLCLSLENMRKKTLPWVFIVAERVGWQMLWEARKEVSSSSSVRQQGRTCLAQPYGC